MTLDDIMALAETFAANYDSPYAEDCYNELRIIIATALDEARAERQEWCAKVCEDSEHFFGIALAAAIRKGPTP